MESHHVLNSPTPVISPTENGPPVPLSFQQTNPVVVHAAWTCERSSMASATPSVLAAPSGSCRMSFRPDRPSLPLRQNVAECRYLREEIHTTLREGCGSSFKALCRSRGVLFREPQPSTGGNREWLDRPLDRESPYSSETSPNAWARVHQPQCPLRSRLPPCHPCCQQVPVLPVLNHDHL